MSEKSKGNLILLIVAVLWGSGFISQKPVETETGLNYVTARFSFLGSWTPLVAAAAAAAMMGVFIWLKEKKNQDWVDNFAIAGSMLFGMIATVLVSL